jgi:uncharacterized membrane protein YdfJ with MMPL/SSD domain
VNRLARLVTRRPRRVVGIAVLFVILSAVVGGPLPGLLDAGDDFDDPGSQSAAARRAIEHATGTTASPGVVALVPTPAGATSPEGQQALADAASRLGRVPGVAQVVTPAEGGATLVARDGSSAILPALLDASADEGDVVTGAEAAFAGTDVVLGGGAVAQEQISGQVQDDLLRAELIALPLLLVLCLWIFRSPIAALLPVLVGASTVMVTFLVLRLVDAGLTDLSAFALNLVTGLGLGLAIDYSLLLVSRFREELGRGREPADAIGATLMTAGRTVVFSALTVSAALLALVVFPQRFLQSMGIAGAVVPLVAAAISLTLLAGVLALLGHRIDAFTPRRLVRHEPSSATLHRTWWYRLAQGVLRRPGRVATATAVLLVLLGLPFLGARFIGVDASVLPSQHSSRQLEDTLRAEYERDASSPVLVAVEAGPQAATDVAAYRERLASVAGQAAVSPPRPLDGAWRIDVYPSAPQLDASTKQLVRDLRAVHAPFPVMVGGQTARFLDQQDGLAERIPLALAILIGTTIVLLFLMTGSIVLPLKAVLMNALTVSATFGLLVLIFQDGNLTGLLDYEPQGALEATQPILLFAIAFALSTDYGTFLLGRIMEAHAAGSPDREAVAIGLARTGRIVTAAALLLTVAIGAFATSEIVFIKLIGVGAALAVVIDATIVRALLVPALMGLLGRWNWYAPRWLQRVHRRAGLHEHAATAGPASAPAGD